jgi:hypothetical protein
VLSSVDEPDTLGVFGFNIFYNQKDKGKLKKVVSRLLELAGQSSYYSEIEKIINSNEDDYISPLPFRYGTYTGRPSIFNFTAHSYTSMGDYGVYQSQILPLIKALEKEDLITKKTHPLENILEL